MSRYPFRERANDFLDAYKDIYSKATHDERRRRLYRIAKDLESLKAGGKISTVNPALMTPEDVREFYSLLKGRNLSAKGISHEISALKNICSFFGNNAVTTARAKYPALTRRFAHSRLNSLTRTEYNKILGNVSTPPEDYLRCRAYAAVLLSIGAGLRTKELQFARIENLDLDEGTLYIDRVKGEGTYGEARLIPLRIECIRLMRSYLAVLERDTGFLVNAGFIFHSPDGNYLSTNSLRKIKELVCRETGIDFSFQTCRRTYGQYALDDGISLESVSVCMGHRTTKTTETYYARRRGSVAVEEARKRWGAD